MKQYLITAYDYTDIEALDRRIKVREQHLAGAKSLKANGNFLFGGAMINEDGKMVGSTLVLQFENEDDLEDWKKTEIYILEKVWEKIEITDFKVANV